MSDDDLNRHLARLRSLIAQIRTKHIVVTVVSK